MGKKISTAARPEIFLSNFFNLNAKQIIFIVCVYNLILVLWIKKLKNKKYFFNKFAGDSQCASVMFHKLEVVSKMILKKLQLVTSRPGAGLLLPVRQRLLHLLHSTQHRGQVRDHHWCLHPPSGPLPPSTVEAPIMLPRPSKFPSYGDFSQTFVMRDYGPW